MASDGKAPVAVDSKMMTFVETIPPDVYAVLEKLRNGELPKKEMETIDITSVTGVEIAGVKVQLETLKETLVDQKMTPYIDSIVPTLEAMAPDNKFNKIKQAIEKTESSGKYEFVYVLVKKYHDQAGKELYDFYGVGATDICTIDVPYLGKILALLAASGGFTVLAAGTFATGGLAMILAGGASATAALASGLMGVVNAKNRITSQDAQKGVETVFEAWIINELESRGFCVVDPVNSSLYAKVTP